MTILSLWLPILLSAVAVFVVSSIIHMVLGYHANNFKKIPDEETFRAAVGPLNVPPGEYIPLPTQDAGFSVQLRSLNKAQLAGND